MSSLLALFENLLVLNLCILVVLPSMLCYISVRVSPDSATAVLIYQTGEKEKKTVDTVRLQLTALFLVNAVL